MIDKTKLLIDGGFEQLNNNYWIFKGQDPNYAHWFTTDEAIDSLGNSKLSQVAIRINETDEIKDLYDAMDFLGQRYALSTTNEAKCVKYLINYIKSKNL
jgi:hypothetical protein